MDEGSVKGSGLRTGDTGDGGNERGDPTGVCSPTIGDRQGNCGSGGVMDGNADAEEVEFVAESRITMWKQPQIQDRHATGSRMLQIRPASVSREPERPRRKETVGLARAPPAVASLVDLVSVNEWYLRHRENSAASDRKGIP
jgi:hypothetical protein